MENHNSRDTSSSTQKPVIGFWAGDLNNFQFIDPIIERLGEFFDVRRFKFDRNNLEALERNMRACDLAWFDWANDGVVPASFNKNVDIPIACRLHRYEVYNNFPIAINWSRINKLVFVSESVRESFKSFYPEFYNKTDAIIIRNGIDLNKFDGDLSRPRGKHVAYVGRLHSVKNPSLLLQCFAALAKKDSEYTFHVAGDFSEQVIEQYFWDQVVKLGLKDSLTYYGKISTVDSWLKNMDFMILPSIIEGEPLSALEAMASGVKPVIFDYVNANRVFPEKYLFRTVDECVEKILDVDFDRAEYRSYVETNNDFELQVTKIKTLIESLLLEQGIQNNNVRESVCEKTIDDWDILIPESRFITPDDLKSFSEKLKTSEAEVLKVKVVYPILEDHLIGRWEIAAVSKTISSNQEELADCRAICEEEIHLPYNDALEVFMAKDFSEALDKFIRHYQNATDSADKTVYVRWLALCLIELGRDEDALNVLRDSIELTTDNADLYYLYLTVSLLSNRTDQIQSVIDTVYELGDALTYPEFICNIREKTEELANLLAADQLSA